MFRKTIILVAISVFATMIWSCSSTIKSKMNLNLQKLDEDICCENGRVKYDFQFAFPIDPRTEKNQDTLDKKAIEELKEDILETFDDENIDIVLRIFDGTTVVFEKQLNYVGQTLFQTFKIPSNYGEPWKFEVPVTLKESDITSDKLNAKLIIGNDEASETYEIGRLKIDKSSTSTEESFAKSSNEVKIDFNFQKPWIYRGEDNKIKWNVTKPRGAEVQLSLTGAGFQKDQGELPIYPNDKEEFTIRVIRNKILLAEKTLTADVKELPNDLQLVKTRDSTGKEETVRVYGLNIEQVVEEGNVRFKIGKFGQWYIGEDLERITNIATKYELFDKLNDLIKDTKSNEALPGTSRYYYILIRGAADKVENPKAILTNIYRSPIENDILNEYNSSKYLQIILPVALSVSQPMEELIKQTSAIGQITFSNQVNSNVIIPSTGYTNENLPDLRSSAVRHLYLYFLNRFVPATDLTNWLGIKVGLIKGYVKNEINEEFRTISIVLVSSPTPLVFDDLKEINNEKFVNKNESKK